ncbi:hypothetical protein G6F31_020864 [Rhizopus arrhizus]|nr:hypothetical protein G6F31_020864 [Rhizopus arrhizus]
MANGFVHKLESVNAFVACHHPSSAAHSVPFRICNSCHSAGELEAREIVTSWKSAPRSWASSRRHRPWKCTGSARAAPGNATVVPAAGRHGSGVGSIRHWQRDLTPFHIGTTGPAP